MENADRKFYLDSMVNQKDGTIIRLENTVERERNHYEDLLWKAAEMNDQKDLQLQSKNKVIASQATQIKSFRKKTRWQKIKGTAKDVVIVGLTATVIYQAVKED